MSNIQFDILMGNVDINMGSILENVIAQEIKSKGFDLHYFDSKKIGEIDFVIQNGMQVDLLEVKSGNDYKKHNAMNKMLEMQGWNFGQAYVFSHGNLEQYGEILYLPWYMIMFYRRNVILQSQKYEVDLSGL